MVNPLSAELTELVAHPDLFHMDEKTMDVCRRLDAFAQNVYHAYQDLALQEVEMGIGNNEIPIQSRVEEANPIQ